MSRDIQSCERESGWSAEQTRGNLLELVGQIERMGEEHDHRLPSTHYQSWQRCHSEPFATQPSGHDYSPWYGSSTGIPSSS